MNKISIFEKKKNKSVRYTSRFLFFLMPLLFVSLTGFSQFDFSAQPAGTQMGYTYSPNEKITGYLIYLPKDYYDNPTKKFPTVVFFHGAGEHGTNLETLKKTGPPKMIAQGKDFPFILISPQARYTWDNNIPNANELLDKVRTGLRVDDKRFYVTGLSNGGAATWYYTNAYPEKVAAAIPICGWGNPSTICDMKNVPVWAFHNQGDGTVSVNATIATVSALAKCPANPLPLQTIYPVSGHDAWTRTYNNDEVWNWLLSHTKSGTIPPPNTAPVANAGNDQSLTLPDNSITLTGSATDLDGTISSFAWTKTTGPSATLSNANTAALKVTNLIEGSYTFRLTVTDNKGAVHYDEVKVTVNPAPEENKVPVANAGLDKVLTLPLDNTKLSGYGTDVDGQIISYNWKKKEGPGVTMVDQDKATLTLSEFAVGVYNFELTVTDNEGAIASDEVLVTVQPAINNAPIANAGNDKILNLPDNSITLIGSGSDADGEIVSYQWMKVSGPDAKLSDTDKSSLKLENLVEGVYTLRLTVTDDEGAVGFSQVLVTVNPAENNAPIANAGGDLHVVLPSGTIKIVGSAADNDGTIMAYQWTKTSGPDIAITDAESSTVSLDDIVEGTYTFSFQVTDNSGASATDEVKLVVVAAENNSPIADAGNDVVLELPENSVTLQGSGSDSDGEISAYRWDQISGPPANITDASKSSIHLSDLVEGDFVFKLTVSDNRGAIGTDEVKITVNPAKNIAPVANAGSDKNVVLPENSAVLYGAGSDVDGYVTVYRWEKTLGPEITITDSDKPALKLNNLVEGDYTFVLKVTDNKGAEASDEVKISVLPAENLAPIVNAGADKFLTLPDSEITINGTASDTDGTIATYTWTKVDGPSAIMTDVDKADMKLSGLVEGSYTFQLVATDNEGTSASDWVKLTVNAADNVAPIANAGSDQELTLPENSIDLIGSANDSDGEILSFHWEKLSGPAANLGSVDKAALTISGLTAGTYLFRLTVTDDDGALNYDEVKLTVNAPANILPIVDAGVDKEITLPENILTLNGDGSDEDGTIASFQWSKVSGNEVTMQNANTADMKLNGLTAGTYVFRLTVSDNNGASASDEVKVIVNRAANKAPIANAGADKILVLPNNNLTLYGSAWDRDGSIIAYKWEKIEGPAVRLGENTKTSLNLTEMVEGEYLFRFTATDNDGSTHSDDVNVRVTPVPNKAPIANAGADKLVTLPVNSFVLEGSGSDSDGTIAGYHWQQLSGPSAELLNADKSSLTVSELANGIYTFQLTVTDNRGDKGSDNVVVIVNNPPMVNAGADKTIQLPTNSTYLSGAGSDSDGKIVSYYWKKKSGPSVTIENQSSYLLNLKDLVEGVYVFTLEVKDDRGAKSTDDIKLTVLAAVNSAPIVDAGPDHQLELPLDQLVIRGTASDPDGVILAYRWTKISGPEIAMSNSKTADLTLYNFNEGAYTFRLTVTDNAGTESFDEVDVQIATPVTDLVLEFNVRNNRCYGDTFGFAEVVVSGGKAPYSYYWTNGATTSAISNLGAGYYTVTVTDSNGKMVKETVEVTDPEELKVTADIQHESKRGNDGSIRLSITGGVEPYTIEWSDNTSDISNEGLSQGTYTVDITDANGCFTSQTYRVNKVQTFTTAVYPNPSDGAFSIKIENMDADKYAVRVFDAQGTFVAEQTGAISTAAQVESLDLRGHKKGFYFVKISYDNGIEKTIRVAIF